jgi:hypothetical protein
MTEIKFETYWPKKYNGEYIGGWDRCPLFIPNMSMDHWYYHVHYFTCIIGGKQFTYIKDNQDELTGGTGQWTGFDMTVTTKGWRG